MGIEAVKHVMAVLPDRLGDDQRRGGREGAEHLHALLLAGDEAVAGGFVHRMAAADFKSLGAHGEHHLLLHGVLRGPAHRVRREAQVAAGD